MTQRDYSDEVLEETPARATKLLAGIGRYSQVRTLLAAKGLSDDDLVQGRALLLACLAEPTGAGAANDTESARRQREAVAELDAWDEPNFPRFSAALDRLHPSVGDVIFQNLKASTGPDAVTGMATFVVRVEGLVHATRSARDAKAANVSDAVSAAAKSYESIPVDERRAALALLHKRGLTAEEIARLSALVNVALGPTEVAPQASEAEAAKTERRRAALTALRRWHDDWAATARSTIRKKQHLIAMGLASRKSPSPKAPAPTPPVG